MIENRAVGIKSREVYEAPAAIALIDRALGARGRRADEGRGADQAAARAALDGDRLRGALVQPGARGDRRLRRHDAGARHGRGARSSCGRTPRSSPGAARRTCCTPSELASYGTGETFPHEAAEGFIRISALETELARRPGACRDQGIIRRVTTLVRPGRERVSTRCLAVPARRRRRAAPVRLRGDRRARPAPRTPRGC